ncbi:POTRA domain-containing protein [Spirochaeta cellobiosiphila]|uniref:POTRA domain-containing protein n=1 Tax=Spirochaeta cellobiosiphila TaxID=504483 RepID=UPI0003F696B3|nr:POTRA domain-containing protein [Spirochaeta cellobiosiphila]
MMRNLFLLPLMSLCLLSSLGAQRIENINVMGLQRTKKFIVLDLLSVKKGDEYTEETNEKVKQDLLKSGLFFDIETEFNSIDEDTGELTIFLQEKWTLIPLPFATVSSGNISGGLFLLDSNLLGLRKSLVTGSVVSSDSLIFLLTYVDPNLFGSPYKNVTNFFYGNEEDITRLTFTQAFGRDFFDKTFGITTGLKGTFIEDEKWESYPGGTLNLNWDKTKQQDLSPTGFMAGLSNDLFWDVSNTRPVPSTTLEMSYKGRFSKRNLFNVNTAYRYSDEPDSFRSSIGGSKGSFSLPGSEYYPNNFFTSYGEYAFALYEGDSFYSTLNLYGERGYQDDEDPFWFSGIGGGFQLLLKKIAIPAMAFYSIYNIEEDTWESVFSIGISR